MFAKTLFTPPERDLHRMPPPLGQSKWKTFWRDPDCRRRQPGCGPARGEYAHHIP